jgi:hypothetical protein
VSEGVKGGGERVNEREGEAIVNIIVTVVL